MKAFIVIIRQNDFFFCRYRLRDQTSDCNVCDFEFCDMVVEPDRLSETEIFIDESLSSNSGVGKSWNENVLVMREVIGK